MTGGSIGRPVKRSTVTKRQTPGRGRAEAPVGGKRVEINVIAILEAAAASGLLDGKSGRIGGRVSPALVKRAKERTGIVADTELIAFALANVALEDDFAEVFAQSRGLIDPDIKLGY